MIKLASFFPNKACFLESNSKKCVVKSQSPIIIPIIWLDEEPGADLELGYFEFFTNPNLIPRRFLSEAILLTVADFMEEIRFGETYFDREKSRMSLDTWLTENFFLFYVAYSYKMHHMDPQIRGLEDMMYGYYNLRKIWVPLSDHLSNSHNKTD